MSGGFQESVRSGLGDPFSFDPPREDAALGKLPLQLRHKGFIRHTHYNLIAAVLPPQRRHPPSHRFRLVRWAIYSLDLRVVDIEFGVLPSGGDQGAMFVKAVFPVGRSMDESRHTLGDLVKGIYDGFSATKQVRRVSISVSDDGSEKIRVELKDV